ncbi:MAG: DUF2764 family protein [Methylomonas sp.]
MKEYYTVVSSLPHLPYFAAAERLPLSRLRLEQRLRMLDAAESEQIFQAEWLVGWRPAIGKFRKGSEIAARYKTALQNITEPVLREFVEYRLDMQTLLAALRIRQAGLDPQQVPGWGIGRWVKHIEAHWEMADFRLGTIYPWLPAAGNHLATANAIALDRLLMETVWRRLSRLGDVNPFGFGAITAFVFKWDILQAWLLRDANAAKQRFQILIEEIQHVQ